MQKGTSTAASDLGWGSTNNSNWALSRNNYVTTNKNAAGFGNNALSRSDSGHFVNDG